MLFCVDQTRRTFCWVQMVNERFLVHFTMNLKFFLSGFWRPARKRQNASKAIRTMQVDMKGEVTLRSLGLVEKRLSLDTILLPLTYFQNATFVLVSWCVFDLEMVITCLFRSCSHVQQVLKSCSCQAGFTHFLRVVVIMSYLWRHTSLSFKTVDNGKRLGKRQKLEALMRSGNLDWDELFKFWPTDNSVLN